MIPSRRCLMLRNHALTVLAIVLTLPVVAGSQTGALHLETNFLLAKILADSANARRHVVKVTAGNIMVGGNLNVWRSVRTPPSGAVVTREITAARAAQPLLPGEIRTRRLDFVAKPVPDTGFLEWEVPIQIMVRDQQGMDREVFPRVRMQGEGLIPAPGSGEYSAIVLVRLASAGNSDERFALERPITIQLTGGATSYAPSTWEHGYTGIPFKEVRVGALFVGPHPPAVDCIVMAGSESDTATLVLPVLDVPVTVSPSALSLQGFGVEAATLIVTGAPPGEGGNSVVVVEAATGTFSSQRVALDRGGTGEVRFRSGRPGVALVVAKAAQTGMVSSPVSVTTVLPYVFFLCALAGGLLGALLHEFGFTPHSKRSHRSKGRGIRLLVGVGAGFLLALLYGLGINPIPMLVPGIAGDGIIFAVSIVGGLIGVSRIAALIEGKGD
jgi:hypothetical protein